MTSKTDNLGGGHATMLSPEAQMAALDRLPQRLRDWVLHEGAISWSGDHVGSLYRKARMYDLTEDDAIDAVIATCRDAEREGLTGPWDDGIGEPGMLEFMERLKAKS